VEKERKRTATFFLKKTSMIKQGEKGGAGELPGSDNISEAKRGVESRHNNCEWGKGGSHRVNDR